VKNKKSSIAYILLIFWPFIYFFPLTSEYIVMGNDFDLIYFSYKKYIFEFIQEGQIPLWSPSEGSGFTLIYNPFAQFFYLPSWLLFGICMLKKTFSLYDYLIFTISGISIYLIGQYQWLKSFKIFSRENIFLITLIVPTILIISNFLRFPNAIHTFCWLPFLLLGINYATNSSKKIKSALLIFFSSLFILTAGYPYFIAYIFLFVSLYILLIILLKKIELKNIYFLFVRILIPSIIALLISLPWLYGVVKTLSIAQDRNLNNFEYSTGHEFNFLDIIGSWIFPISSNTEGRYYFGIIISFLIIKWVVDIFKNSKKLKTQELYIVIFSFLSFLLISSLASSGNSYLFIFLWEKIDLIKNMRTWPRINILMVPLVSLIFLISLKSFLLNLKELTDNKIKKYKYNFISTNFIFFIIIIIQILFYFNDVRNDYWYTWHEKRVLFASENLFFPLNKIVMMSDGRINIFSSFISIIIINYIYLNIDKLNYTKFKKIFLYSILLIVSFEQFINSNVQWSLKEWKTQNTEKIYNADYTLKKTFNSPRLSKQVHGNNYFRDEAFTINNFLNWGNKFHNKIFWKYFNQDGSLKKNLSEKQIKNILIFFGLDKFNKKIFFSSNIYFNNPVDFIDESLTFEHKNIKTYKINNFGNNFIDIEFTSVEDGWITYIDNNDIFWHATINDIEVEISSLMDAYKSINFLSGKNKLKLNYEPFRY